MNLESFNFAQILMEHKDLEKSIKEKINKKVNNTNVTFESNILYDYFLIQINNFLPEASDVIFNSKFSALYFRRIFNYLEILIKSDIDIVEDETIKIFFFLLFILMKILKEKKKN